jgi:flavodoxin
MPTAFLRAYSGKVKVYEVAWDNGNVVINVAPPADLSAVDRIWLLNPANGERQLQFSVFPGTLKAHDPLWQQLDFKTRCFLTPPGRENLAPVHLKLKVASGQIVVSDFEMFDVPPSNGIPGEGLPITGLQGLRFFPTLRDLQVNSFQTPELLAKLGISTRFSGQVPDGWSDPQLECYPGLNGVSFSVILPLLEDKDPQRLLPYGITFSPDDSNLQSGFDNRRVLTFSQSPANVDDAASLFWILQLTLPPSIVFESWNNVVATPFLDSLNMVRSGLPASFLPTLSALAGETTPFTVSFALVDKAPSLRTLSASNCAFRDPESALAAGYLNIVTRTILLTRGQVRSTANFPNLLREDGDPLQAACLITALAALSGNDQVSQSVAGYCFGFQHQFDMYPLPPAPPPTGQPSVRMGALDLKLPKAPLTPVDLGRQPGSLRASLRTIRSGIDDVPGPLVRLDFLQIDLAVSALAVGGQDDVPGSEYAPPNQPYPRGSTSNTRRAPSVQIVKDDFPPNGAYFVLNVNETCYELISQTLSLRIEQQRLSSSSGGGGDLDLIVFDPEPFLIARVFVPDYQQSLREALTDQIASWDNSAANASWQISAGTQAFQMTLPPQGVTEAMHKRSDLPTPDITPGAAIDYRFTPPAVLDLRASATPQRFVEVPWNLRRILGYPQQSVPGAVLDAATFELVYGLSATLKAKAGIMLAEVGARLGQFPDAPDMEISWQHSDGQESGYDSYTKFWANLLPQLRTRIAALELWTGSQPEGLTLTQDDSLAFHLRAGADLAYPVEGAVAPPNIPDGSLRGSFSWAFESERLYQSLWANPNSVTAEMNGLAFSALGGWGQFTARFANGKTSVIATVRMGRIQTLTIEQSGRVGNFWNRAKLVTTYERTVTASDQFYLQQQPLLGNPILRKTAEYVQLLEKRRDAPANDPVGAYSACEFPEGDPPRIPVDSTWGENVGKYGYKIPLWRPGAQPAFVYTKPIVRLHLKCALSDGTVAPSIADPEKLCFYTTTDPNLGSDTDTWSKQVDADFGYVTSDFFTAPTDPAQLAQGSQGRVSNFNAPEEPWIQPGLGAFTYSLNPAPLTANVTAGLSVDGSAVKPVGAALRTITIMRGLDQSAVLPAGHVYATSIQIPDHVSNILRPAVSLIQASASAAELAKNWSALEAQAVTNAKNCASQLAAFANSVPATAEKLCGALTDQLTGQLAALDTQIHNEVAGLLAGAHDLLVPATPPTGLTKLRSDWADLYGAIKAQLRFTKSQIASWAIGLRADVDKALGGFASRLQKLDSDLKAATDPKAALQLVTAAAQELDSGLAQADSFIDGTLRPITGGKIDQLRQTITELRNQISAAARTATADLATGTATAIAQARADLQGLVTNCTDAKAALDALIDGLNTATSNFAATTVEATLDRINTALTQATDWNAFITAARADLDALSTGLQATVDTHLAELKNKISAYAGLACQQILQTDLKKVLDAVTSILNPDAVQQFFDNWQGALTNGADVSAAVEDYLHGLESTVGQFLNAVRPQLTLPSLPDVGADATMFLLRGFGDVPKVPQLDFNLAFTAFRFADLKNSLPIQLPQVNLTPLVGWANNLASGDNPINLGLPTFQLGSNLIPFSLDNFDLGSLLPHVAGMDLSHLFQGFRLPNPLPVGQYVNVTHGEDLQSRSAWVDIDLNVGLGDEAEVFSYFGVTVVLRKANIQANTHLQGQVGQPLTRTMKGSITGSWSIAVGGFEVVVLEDCSLTFDQSGHFGFNVTPAKVKPQAVLQFLADLISDFFSGDGFTTSITAEGVQTVLDLPLPDIQSGTFGIANLRLMCSFGLIFAPFEIQLGLALAKPENPFTLTIFILGGAGYLELDASYTPSNNRIATDFHIGIFASASLAISLGPVSGGIYAYFGIAVAYHAETGSAADLQVALVIMFVGQVSLLGFVSVSLVLSLSANYDSTTHVLIGRGTVSYSIKISFFFTINVSAGVSYKFSNHTVPAALGAAPPPAVYDAAATEYLAMFYN